MNMKKILIAVVVLLALVGVLAIVMYAVNHRVQIKEVSLLPRENIKTGETAQFTLVMRVESETLALIEDQSLLGLSAGSFDPRFESLSTVEQNTLNASMHQNPELENMTAGNLDSNAGLGGATWGSVLLVILGLVILF
jgi:hypothetical protein